MSALFNLCLLKCRVLNDILIVILGVCDMKSQRKALIMFVVMLLLIAVLSVGVFSGTCFFALNRNAQENRIDDFDKVMPDFQLVADRLLGAYKENVSSSDTELTFCPEYDSGNKTYYLSSESGRFEDVTFCRAFTAVYDSFDSDFPLFYVCVSESQVSFCNSAGDFAVIYSAENIKPDYLFCFGSHVKAKQTINEGCGWYQVFI